MRKLFSLLLVCVATIVSAQTLNVQVGEVTYQVPAAQAGDMVYSDGTSLTILNKQFALADITRMYVDNTKVTDNSVSVTYNGTTADVKVAGNCMQYLTVEASGADVSIVQDASLADELTYTLSGSSTDGSFTMDGKLKATVVLSNLTLANADGCPFDIENGKRIKITLEGTNSLTDASANTKKGCLYVKGHTEMNGSGTLTVTASGSKAHGVYSGEYFQLTKKFTGTLTIAGSTKDGIHCSQYFLMNGGNVVVTSTGDDGIQAEAEDAAEYDEEEGMNGCCMISGGNVDITLSAESAKGICCDSTLTVDESKSAVTIKVTGLSTAYAAKGLKGEKLNIEAGTITTSMAGKGIWDEDDLETSACAGLKGTDITINGGTLTLTATGSGGKGISSSNSLTVNGGDITATTSGGCYYNNGTTENTNYTGSLDNISTAYKSSAKAIKVGEAVTTGRTTVKTGSIVINGGKITATTKTNGAEGIECKGTIDINGGEVNVTSYDDAINSGLTQTISGGTVTVNASNNDGLDSNGDLWIKGGTIIAYGTTSPECGIDANEEENYHVYFTGGTLLAIGGSNSVPANSNSTQAYVTTTGSVTSGNTITLKSGTTTLASFTVTRSYGSSGGGGGFGPGGGGPGGGGSSASILITCPGLTNGSSYTLTNGTSSSNVTARQYGSSSTGGGGRR